MIEIPTLSELMAAGAHFGHKKEKTHPKVKQFTYMVKDQIYVIDLEKTRQLLGEALEVIEKFASQGKNILIVGTKKQAQEIVGKYAKDAGLPYINYKWLSGMLTNFDTIKSRIKYMDQLEEKVSGEKSSNLTKKEKSKLQEELDKTHRVFDGIKDLKGLPDALFVIDVAREKIAISEAVKMGIPVFAIIDTNANPQLVNYPIPANDDARKTLEIILGLVSKAYKEGDKKFKVVKSEKEAKEVKESK